MNENKYFAYRIHSQMTEISLWFISTNKNKLISAIPTIDKWCDKWVETDQLDNAYDIYMDWERWCEANNIEIVCDDDYDIDVPYFDVESNKYLYLDAEVEIVGTKTFRF